MVGTVALGRYRLLRSLGAGSNAEVFLAEPLDCPDFPVVVKRIHDHVVAHPKFRQLFEAEVRSMADFTHPYAVRLLEADVDDPIGPCLVMEYVPGVTLEDLLRKRRVLPPERVGRLLGQFCHALQAAHEAGIVHRDLKPANLMVLKPDTPHETLKVMDFGFAGFAAKPHIQLAELTGHGPIYAIGTPAYVSPEMIRGDRVDARSDLYSVGVILFELLTGRLPFDYPYQEQLLKAHIQEAPPRFARFGCGHVPPALEAVVHLALSKYPNERHQSARELAAAFGRALHEEFWDATAPEGWEPLPLAEDTVDDEAGQPVVRREPDGPFHVLREFEAYMPERLAAAKLRGFVEDFKAQVLASEPGLIRLRLGVPDGYQSGEKKRSGIMSWFAVTRPAVPRGQEPMELELQIEKPDPNQPRLLVALGFRPLPDYPPPNERQWAERCDKLHHILRQYMGA
ncbi:MAG: serine/threonine protein kinase [Gemmataceae bacterium]|nr:serine/threonine protein kinase [Gemmataceae bacterium]